MKYWVTFLYAILLMLGCNRNNQEMLKETEVLLSKARSLEQQWKYQEAISTYRGTIVMYGELQRDTSAADVYLLLGACQRQIGLYDSTVVNYKQASEMFHSRGDKKKARKADLALAGFYLSIGEYEKALIFADISSATAKVLVDEEDKFNALLIAADAQHYRRKYQEELLLLDELMRIDSVLYLSRNRIRLFARQLQAHEDEGSHDRARTVFERWKMYARGIADDDELARAYFCWGNIQETARHPDSAFKAYSLAVSRIDQQSDKMLRADILSSLGRLAYQSKRFDDGLRYCIDALAIVNETDNYVYEQMLELLITACEWKKARIRAPLLASELLRRCATIETSCRERSFRMGEALALFLRAALTGTSDTTQQARLLYRQAWQVVENEPEHFDAGGIGSRIISTVLDGEGMMWYDPVMEVYIEQENTAALVSAIENLNLFEIRKYFTRLSLRTPDNISNELITKIQWRYKGIRLLEQDILDELSKWSEGSLERVRLLNEQLREWRTEMLTACTEMGRVNNNLSFLLAEKIPILRQIQNTMKENQLLIEFIQIHHKLSMVIVAHDTSYVRQVSIERQRLQGFVGEYCRLLSDPRLDDERARFDKEGVQRRINELSYILGRIFLDPIGQLIRNSSLVYIVPPVDFGWLPFHTLEVNGDFLLRQVEVSYLPTAAAILFSTQPDKQVKDVVGFGHPGNTGWDVEYELRDIRSFYDSAKIIVEEDAMLKNLDGLQYDFLHLSAEFDLDAQVPDNSGIFLSDGKSNPGVSKVPLSELMNIALPAALMFSNVADQGGALSRYAPLAFLSKGIPVVIAGMWRGDRKSRRYFDEVFYTGMYEGLFPSQAYHDAVMAMMKKKEYSPIHAWGMFYRFGR